MAHIHNGILLSLKKKRNEGICSEVMELDSVIQSEVSQKEKSKYSMLTHIYGILKKKKKERKWSEEPRGKMQNKDADLLENGLEDTGRGKGKLGQSERVTWTYIHYET